MAVACAASFGVSQLLFLTDVDGVRDAGGQVRPVLTVGDALELIRDGVATGGMQAKLEAAIDALHQGVGEVRIAPGAQPGVVGSILNQHRVGTRIVP
jgi:acetylglutamate kinase